MTFALTRTVLPMDKGYASATNQKLRHGLLLKTIFKMDLYPLKGVSVYKIVSKSKEMGNTQSFAHFIFKGHSVSKVKVIDRPMCQPYIILI